MKSIGTHFRLRYFENIFFFKLNLFFIFIFMELEGYNNSRINFENKNNVIKCFLN